MEVAAARPAVAVVVAAAEITGHKSRVHYNNHRNPEVKAAGGGLHFPPLKLMKYFYIEKLLTWTENAQACAFHPGGMLRIEDDRSIRILKSLEPLGDQCLEESALLGKLPAEEPESVIKDLIELKLIRPLHELFCTWEQMDLLTDRPDMLEELVQHLKVSRQRVIHLSNPEDTEYPGDVAIIYLDAYKPETMRTMWEKGYSSYRLIQCCYRLDRFLYLDNPYIRELQNATHWANLTNLAHKSEQDITGEGDYFAQFRARDSRPGTYPAIPLNNLEQHHVEYLIYRRLEKLMGLTLNNFRVDELNTAECYDLTSDKLYHAIATNYEQISADS